MTRKDGWDSTSEKNFNNAWQEYEPLIIQKARDRLEDTVPEGVITFDHAYMAIRNVVSGAQPVAVPGRSRIADFLTEHLFLWVAILLTIVFGVFAVYGGAAIKASNSGFLDIAKIFAGAIVGSAAGPASTAVHRIVASRR